LKYRISRLSYKVILFISLLAILFPPATSAQLFRKSQVSFNASDGLIVSADLYQSVKSNPYIILFHQEKSCKGEFDSIASRFIKMNFNCMAVDLRSGDNLEFVKNETAIRAKEGGYSNSLSDASKDFEAAINFLYEISGKGICLFGSASSASLALIIGRENEHVKAIVAFSPGEYFAPEYQLKSILANYPKPVFVGCTAEEFLYLSDIEGFPGTDKILFRPSTGEGLRGTHALLKENPSRDEYWLSLLIFFKSLQ
jgi:dienelactone hydrolase